MHHTDPSRTQALSLQLVEKVFQLYEQNEKLVNFRNGEPNFYSRPNQRMCSIDLKLFLCGSSHSFFLRSSTRSTA